MNVTSIYKMGRTVETVNEKKDWKKVIAVTNRNLCIREPFLKRIERLADLGAHAILLREKDLLENEYEALAGDVLKICRARGTTCILHSYPEVAEHLSVSALHLPLWRWKEIKEQDKTAGFETLGISVHSVEEAKQAEQLGATYLIAGHVFATDCKKGLPPRGLDFLQSVCQSVSLPVYAIGGIDWEKMDLVMEAGAAGGCMMSGLMQAP